MLECVMPLFSNHINIYIFDINDNKTSLKISGAILVVHTASKITFDSYKIEKKRSKSQPGEENRDNCQREALQSVPCP